MSRLNFSSLLVVSFVLLSLPVLAAAQTPTATPQVVAPAAKQPLEVAGLGTGVWSSTSELAATWRLDRRFEPVPGVRDDGAYARWLRAVERSKHWDDSTLE